MKRLDARSVRHVRGASVERALPPGLAPAVWRVAAAGERLGLGVHLVGGPVRDLLLGRPLLDVDLLVEPRDGEAHEPALRLAEAALAPGERIVAHARFGTVTLFGPHGGLDLARARAEQYAAPGALPEVRAGTLEEDLARRDFAVNAMAIPLNAPARRGRGPLVDPLGGRADLAARRLRVLHPRSFHDDPTRALRAARLGARLGFRLDAPGGRALREALAAGACAGVSGERFRAELERVFEDAARGLVDPGRVLAALDRTGVLAALARGLVCPRGLAVALGWLGRALAAPPEAGAPAARPAPGPNVAPPAPGAGPVEAGLLLWLGAQPAAVRRRALARLALTGRPADRIAGFVRLARRLERGLARAASRGAEDAILRPVPAEELLAFAALAPRARRRVRRHLAYDRALRPPLVGEDVLALGLRGPAVGRALAALRRAWLDGACRDRASAEAWLRARKTRFEGRAGRT